MKIIKIKDDFYYADISLIVNSNVQNIKDYFKKKYNYTVNELKINGNGYEHAILLTIEHQKTGDNKYFIIIPAYNWTVSQITVLQHEIFHLTYRVMSSNGMPLCDQNEEAYAYYISYLSIKILRILLKKAKINKKK